MEDKGWAARMRCPKGHEVWVSPDSLGYFKTPPETLECPVCKDNEPRFTRRDMRRMKKFLKDL